MKRVWVMLLCVSVLCTALAGCAAPTDTESPSAVTKMNEKDLFSDRDRETSYNEKSVVRVTLDDAGSTVLSPLASVSGNTVTLKAEGEYLLSGTLSDGRIVVDAPKTAKLHVILSGASVNSESGCALYIKQADKVFLTVEENTKNELSNSGDYEQTDDNNVDAVLFSKEDLTVNGNGKLTVTAIYGHGIVSKDDLTVTGGSLSVTAEKHGLSGKDAVKIGGGTLDITAKKDGIHAENKDDASLGYVYIGDGTLQIAAEDDGISAASAVQIAGGTVTVSESYEGIEGQTVLIAGGTTTVTARDDGLNAAGGSDSTNAPGRFGDSSASLSITGGTVTINAEGDGVDSNGDLTVSGGELYISGPTNGGDGALDHGEGSTATVTGGIVVAAGSAEMAENFGNTSTQGSYLYMFSEEQPAKTPLTLSDSSGKTLAAFMPEKVYRCVVVSAPGMKKGGTYTLKAGETPYEFTLSDTVDQNGGARGGFSGGGRGDRQMPDKKQETPPDGERKEPPEGFGGQMPDGERKEPPEGFGNNQQQPREM